MKPTSKFIVHAALFLALAIVLPVAFHQLGLGRVFLPMHIPVLLAGFIGGAVCGVIVGLLAPILSFFMIGMPPAYAVLLMALELALYGLTAGIFYRRLNLNIYVALLISLIVGRLGFALGLLRLGSFIQLPYGVKCCLTVASVSGLPGILIQVVLVPPIVAAVSRRRKV